MCSGIFLFNAFIAIIQDSKAKPLYPKSENLRLSLSIRTFCVIQPSHKRNYAKKSLWQHFRAFVIESWNVFFLYEPLWIMCWEMCVSERWYRLSYLLSLELISFLYGTTANHSKNTNICQLDSMNIKLKLLVLIELTFFFFFNYSNVLTIDSIFSKLNFFLIKSISMCEYFAIVESTSFKECTDFIYVSDCWWDLLCGLVSHLYGVSSVQVIYRGWQSKEYSRLCLLCMLLCMIYSTQIFWDCWIFTLEDFFP